MKTRTLLPVLLVATCYGDFAAANEPPLLRNNPFSRPPSDVVIDDRVSAPRGEVASPTLELQATMVGSVKRLANVGGRILSVGDEVEGYSIAGIYEQYVVFEREGRQTTVYVKPLETNELVAEDNE